MLSATLRTRPAAWRFSHSDSSIVGNIFEFGYLKMTDYPNIIHIAGQPEAADAIISGQIVNIIGATS